MRVSTAKGMGIIGWQRQAVASALGCYRKKQVMGCLGCGSTRGLQCVNVAESPASDTLVGWLMLVKECWCLHQCSFLPVRHECS